MTPARPTVLLSLLSTLTLLPAAAAQEPEGQPPAPVPGGEAPAPPAAEEEQAPTAPPGATTPPEQEQEPSVPWYERLRLRGYTQVRYNRLPTFDPNPDLVNETGDRFLGRNTGFGIRRARLVLSGDVGDRLSLYLQPDFASAIGEQLDVAIMRDWYADVFLDAGKELRLRIGQSKVPFGFENLQSSSVRLPFDRDDALVTATRDERDLGVFLYWTPAEVRERFKRLVDTNLKGSGDYGVVGVGLYNGQGANRSERNDSLHAVARLAWPFLLGSQDVEVNVAGYSGRYVVSLAERDGVAYTLEGDEGGLLDTRGALSLVVYPQPLGFVAEYTVGVGPSQGGPAERTVIASRPLHGGYAQVMYRLEGVAGRSLFPYARGSLYDGGRKAEMNAPRSHVRELELGVEWQPDRTLELTLAYLFTRRTSSRFPYALERGQVARVQLQVNY